MKKFVKILPLCLLMLGVVSCSDSSSTTSTKPETPVTSSSKEETSSSKTPEVEKPSSSEASIESSSSETPVTNIEEYKPIEVLTAASDKVDTTNKNKLLEDFTYQSITFPKNTQLESTNGKTVTDVNGNDFTSGGRFNNVKKLTFNALEAGEKIYFVYTNQSTSNGLELNLKDETGAVVKSDFTTFAKKESGVNPEIVVGEYTTTAAGSFTLETIPYIKEDGTVEAKQGAATIYYIALVSPTNA